MCYSFAHMKTLTKKPKAMDWEKFRDDVIESMGYSRSSPRPYGVRYGNVFFSGEDTSDVADRVVTAAKLDHRAMGTVRPLSYTTLRKTSDENLEG